MPKILVADDEGEVRKVISLLLTGNGWQVIEASDGQVAYDMAIKQKPDLILLDIMMPLMNGFEVLEKLRENPDTKPIPVIMVTALGGGQDEQRAMRLGALDYIAKPWAPGELEDRIRIALPSLSSSGASAGGPAPGNTAVKTLPPLAMPTVTAISSGSDTIDKALLGGITLGSLTLLEGATGTGKTVLCQHLAYGALMAEQGVAFYTSGLTTEDLVARMGSLGLDVTPNLREGQLLVYPLEQFSVGRKRDGGGLAGLRAHIEALPWDVTVVVMDALTSLVTYAGSTPSMDFFMECRTMCRMGKAILICLHTSAFDPEMLSRLDRLFGNHLSLRVEGFTQGIQMKSMNVIDVAKVKETYMQRTTSIFFEVDPELGKSMNMSLKVLPLFRIKS